MYFQCVSFSEIFTISDTLNGHNFSSPTISPCTKHISCDGQTTQWPKEKGQKDKQRSTKYHTEN